MTTMFIGDSVAVGMGKNAPEDTFATVGIAVRNMGDHFTTAIAQAQQGDIAVISAGYNGGITATGRQQLTGWINQLRERGTRVVITGLREDFADGEPYADLAGITPATNQTLRHIARETGATFAEETIGVANSIAGGEIHGKSSQLRAVALTALGSVGAPSPAPAAEEETDEQRNRRRMAETAETADAPRQANGLLGIILAFFSVLFGPLTSPAESAAATPAVQPAPPTTSTQSAAVSSQVAAQARAAVSSDLAAPPLAGTNENLPRLRRDAVALSV